MSKQPRLEQEADVDPPGSAAGVALLITVLILFVVSILGASVVNLGRIDYALSGNYRANTAALNLADSALHSTAADLRADYDADAANSALAAWVNLSANPISVADPFPDPTGMTVNGHVLAPAVVSPDPYVGTPYTMGSAQALGSGTYARAIWLPPTVTTSGATTSVRFRVRATGTDANPATPAVSVVDGVVLIDVTDAGGYASALLLGPGNNGDVISGGSFQFAGPVIVLGESGGNPGRGRGRGRGLAGGAGGTPGSELAFGLSSSMVNGYEGIGGTGALGALATKVPALTTKEYNGDTVAALNSALYLRDTELAVDPGATLGAADAPGNGYQETLDGIYSDGAIDTSGGNIHADQIDAYNLGDLEFPGFSNPYTDPDSGTSYGSYEAYLNTVAYAPLGGSNLEIDDGTASFSFTDPSGKGSISWDAATGILTVDGVVKVNGDVVLGDGDGPLAAVKYAGTGVLWADQDIRIHDDLHPDGQYLEDGADADSAVDGNLGLITENQILLDAESAFGNLQVFASLYGEAQIDVRSHTNIAGAVITNHIAIANLSRLNVWYVPALATGAPFGMPGAGGVAAISVDMTDWFQVR